MTPMRLDVIIPTHNRSGLLGCALQSLLDAERPDDLEVDVTVVDNRSTDYTREVVESFLPAFGGRLHYVYEPKPGRSHALNAGIAATNGDLAAMIDDDEQVDSRWFITIAGVFRDPETHFIGGPYLPVWSVERPAWIGRAYGSVVGWVEAGPEIQQYGPSCNAMLMGGNAVIRRSLLDRVGPYSVDLGRTPGGRLLSCEDEDMFVRLLAAGGRGFYRPDLIIHHYVPAERLTRRYFRRWCFWRGVSLGLIDRRRPAPVRYLFGVPRYVFGIAVRGAWDSARMLFGGFDPARLFKNELAWWDLAGFIYGKHLSGLDRWLTRLKHQTRGDVPSAATSPATPPRS
jgi:glycosyltransferase involved in cell wall biosynthesis